MTDTNDFKIENALGFNVNRTSIVFRKRLTAMLKEAGYEITPEEFSLLSRLWEEDGITQTLLIEKTLKDKTRVTRLLGGLTKKSYVYRQIKEDDRRNQVVFLTEQGKALKVIIVPIVLELMSRAAVGITREEVDITQSVLRRIFSNLNEME